MEGRCCAAARYSADGSRRLVLSNEAAHGLGRCGIVQAGGKLNRRCALGHAAYGRPAAQVALARDTTGGIRHDASHSRRCGGRARVAPPARRLRTVGNRWSSSERGSRTDCAARRDQAAWTGIGSSFIPRRGDAPLGDGSSMPLSAARDRIALQRHTRRRPPSGCPFSRHRERGCPAEAREAARASQQPPQFDARLAGARGEARRIHRNVSASANREPATVRGPRACPRVTSRLQTQTQHVKGSRRQPTVARHAGLAAQNHGSRLLLATASLRRTHCPRSRDQARSVPQRGVTGGNLTERVFPPACVYVRGHAGVRLEHQV